MKNTTQEITISIYRSSNSKIEVIEDTLNEITALDSMIRRLESLNKEKQFETGEPFSFISKKALCDLNEKLSIWNNELQKQFLKYRKAILEKAGEKSEEIYW